MIAAFAFLVGVSVSAHKKNETLVISGITVPPEPSSLINNATLAGVDSNNNGVRDDVERVLAQQFGGTTDYSFAMAYARTYQDMLIAPTPTQRADALTVYSKIMCSVRGGSNVVQNFEMTKLVVNTAARKRARSVFDDVLLGFSPEELSPCATSTSP